MPDEPTQPALAVLTCTAKKWTPTLRRGDKWEVLNARTATGGYVMFACRRIRDGLRAGISADALRLSFRAARFLKSPKAKPTA